MNKSNEVLPIGSIVYLKDGIKKLLIIGRALKHNNDESQKVYDYAACLYPEGMISSEMIFFNSEDIDTVFNYGYSDDDDKQLQKIILEVTKEK